MLRTRLSRLIVRSIRRAPPLPLPVSERLARSVLLLRRRGAGLRRKVRWVGRHEIPYLEGGQGEPVVLVHGFADNKDTFVDLAARLTRQYRVLIPDLLGFGEASYPPDHCFAPREFTRVLAGWVEAVGLQRFHLVGNSLGGAIAVDYYLAHRQRIDTLTLIATAGVDMPHRSPIMEALDRGENPFVVHTEQEYLELIKTVLARPPAIPPAIRRFLAHEAIRRGSRYAKIMQDMLANVIDLTPELETLEVPTLILWGDRDRVMDVSSGKVAHERIPNSELVVLKGIGHAPQLEAVDKTATAMMQFFADRGSRAEAPPSQSTFAHSSAARKKPARARSDR